MMLQDIEVRTLTLAHEGGTKRYKICLITSRDRTRSVMIKRWGKVGTHGEWQIHEGSNHQGESLYSDTLKSKLKRGYSEAVGSEENLFFDKAIAAIRWLINETNEEAALRIVNFLMPEYDGGAGAPELEIIVETPPVVDRSGDKEWASW